MDKKFDIFKNIKKMVRLGDSEKNHARTAIFDFVKKNPVRFMEDERLQQAQDGTSILILKFKYMPIALIVVILLSVGTVFAAESAVPGDFLHPVKTEFNEEVRSTFTFGTESNARWNSRLSERRLEEGELLGAENRLNEELTVRLRERFEAQEQRASELIARLEAEGKTEIAANLAARMENVLEVHEQIIARLAETSDQDISQILDTVRARLQTRVEAREHLEVRANNLSSERLEEVVKNAKVRAENQIEMAESAIAETESKLGSDAVLSAKVNLEASLGHKTEADAYLEAEGYAEALVKYQQAIRLAHSAEVLAKQQLRIDLRIDIPVAEFLLRARSSSDTNFGSGGGQQGNGRTENETDLDSRNEVEIDIELEGAGVESSADIEQELDFRLGQ